jgi:hypothetical protein
MGYEAAISKAWEDLANLKPDKKLTVKFLADEYSVDLEAKSILSLSCNAKAKDFTSIILLHYLIQRLKGLPNPSGEWLTFREISGVEGYAEAYHKRAIEPIIRKYGKNPAGIYEVADRLPAQKASGGDFGIIVEVFPGVQVLVKLWAADEEFGSDANMYFDANITKIFCTEDIVVIAGFVGSSL